MTLPRFVQRLFPALTFFAALSFLICGVQPLAQSPGQADLDYFSRDHCGERAGAGAGASGYAGSRRRLYEGAWQSAEDGGEPGCERARGTGDRAEPELAGGRWLRDGERPGELCAVDDRNGRGPDAPSRHLPGGRGHARDHLRDLRVLAKSAGRGPDVLVDRQAAREARCDHAARRFRAHLSQPGFQVPRLLSQR